MRLSQKRKLFGRRARLLCGMAMLFPCVTACALNPNRDLSQYAHSAWRVQDGSLTGIPNVLAQTSDGYLWVGTRDGLFRFDGVSFVKWGLPDEARSFSPFISALLGARDGSLWIGTLTELLRLKDGKVTTYPELKSSADVIYQDNEGRIWVGRSHIRDHNGPLCQIQDTKSHCYGSADGIRSPEISVLTGDSAGNLWMPDPNGLERWKAGNVDHYHPVGEGANAGNSSGVQTIEANVDGNLWIGTQNMGSWTGLQLLNHGVIQPFFSSELDGRTIRVQVLTATRERDMIVGTVGNGIFQIRDGSVNHFDASDGLTSNTIWDAFEDKEGDLWIATDTGLDCFSDRAVVTFARPQGINPGPVFSLSASKDGDLWISNGAGIDRLSQGKISSIAKDRGCPSSTPTAIYEERPGILWVGLGRELWIHEQGGCHQIRSPNGGSIGPIRAMTKDIDGSMWIELFSVPGRLNHLRNRAVVEDIVVAPDQLRQSLLSDPQGGVWVDLSDGRLAHYRNQKLEMISSFGPPNSSRLDGLTIDPNGRLLGATTDGLVGLQNGVLQRLSIQNGLRCNEVLGVIFDSTGSLWLNSGCGLQRISKQDLQAWWSNPSAKVNPLFLDAFDGNIVGDSRYGSGNARSLDGKLWFVKSGILQMVDPQQLESNAIPPPVHIEQVIANRKSYSAGDDLRLPPLLRDLEIDYTALSFVAPKKVYFRYKLENHDTDWQDTGTRRQAFYNDLPPGHYRFRVIACNNSGLWNQVGDSLDFYVEPTFYQTLWFRTLMGCLAAALVWMVYLFRLKQATTQIQERLCARMEERERIARELHDTLLQGFQGLMLRFQAVLNVLPQQGPARDMVEKALDRADEVLLEGRQRVQNLRVERMTGHDLPDHLAKCGEELAQDHAISFTLSVIGAPQGLDPVVSTEAYRIGREALANAFTHSHGSKIEAELTYEPAQLSLRIRDDGEGMDQETLASGRSGHWGIPGMRERAQKIGARLDLFSRPTSGTEVQLTIPARLAYAKGKKLALWRRIIAFGSKRGRGA